MNIKCLLLLILWGICLSRTHENIPKYLWECYKNNTFHDAGLPMNLPVLIDLIRKAESYSGTSMDMRTISTSLLHRFKFDGVAYYSDMKVKEGVLPFSGTGPQRAKHRIIEELIPGNPEAFPSESLTLIERCALHRAISNTIWDHSAASEDKLCTEVVTEKLSDHGYGRTIPGEVKVCPLEYGVILTPFGTVAPGAIIAAIAASLQPQNVTVKLLLEPVNSDLPDRSMWLKMISRSTTQIDNVWASAVAGDLAEMAIYQGPIVGKRMVLGATGFWNSSMRPTVYYLMGRDGTFDGTRAELIGGIDGLVIAKNLPRWTEKFPALRLSQVLDMYYSNRGSVFDAGIKACDRGKAFWHVAPKTILEEQTYAISQILAYRNSIAYMTEEVLSTMVNHAVSSFTTYSSNHLFTELHCQHNEKLYPKVEAIVVFDGAWSQEYTADFLSVMMEDLDVSMFGSKIGLIHGNTGEWLLNVTGSPAKTYEALSKFNNSPWPSQINFEKVLTQILLYLDSSWQHRRDEAHTVGYLGQVIIFLTPRLRFNTVQQQSNLGSIKKLKAQHPDVHFLYYVTDDNAPLFEPFLLSEEDHLTRSLSINQIIQTLQSVSRVLRPAACNPNSTQGVRDQVEDYVRPRHSVIYRLHPHWRRNTKKVTLTVHNVGYGTIKICTWNQRSNNVRKDDLYCRELSGHSEATFVDYATCNADTRCNVTHYEINGISSRIQCSEIDCRQPDYIRYIIRLENLHCSKTQNLLPNIASLLFVLITILF